MVIMSNPKKPAAGKAEKRKRNVIFLSLDDDAESLLQRFLDGHRVKPDRSAVAYTALVEWLKRELKDKP